jgi:RNase H-fold protein (predicted Holliday junction resolvase)
MEKTYSYSEQAAKEYAKKAAKSVEIRSFVDGNSVDTRCKSTKAEALLVERAIASALFAIKNGYDEASAKATAEYFILYGSGEPHINSYGSVFIPIDNFLRSA